MPTSSLSIVFGFHAVEAILSTKPKTIKRLYLLSARKDKRLQAIHAQAAKRQVPIEWQDRKRLDQLTNGNHQGVVAEIMSMVNTYDEVFLKSHLQQYLDNKQTPFLLVLDGVTDPHNLGACLRSAEAAGVHFVVVPKDNSAALNATAIKVACGAAEIVPLVKVTNLARTLQWLQQQGLWIIGAAGEANKNHFEIDLRGPLAMVMGSEGKGMRRLTRDNCDHLMRIPMMGSVSSLNVSVATGICLFEALRQRQIESVDTKKR
ncbi:MAG: 23S rRNA (guanosine(2251)-2'-O)-methyltransferase RlmB [Pseudomonadota bacterium]